MTSFKRKLREIDLSSWFLSVGIGGITTLYVIDICKLKVLPHFNKNGNLAEQVKTLKIDNISITETVILLVAILSLLISPLLKTGSKGTGIRIFGIISLFFLELFAFMSMILQQRINGFFIFFTLLSSIFCFRLFVEGLSGINKWIRISKEETNQVDVAKLTFIWAIIIALINLLSK